MTDTYAIADCNNMFWWFTNILSNAACIFFTWFQYFYISAVSFIFHSCIYFLWYIFESKKITNMKNLFKVVGFFLTLFLILFIYIFNILIPEKRYLSDIAEEEIIGIFLNGGELVWINRRSLLLREGNIFCKKETIAPECEVAMKRYSHLQQKIPFYASYYFCDDKYTIKNLGSGLHYVWALSPGDITQSGIRVHYNSTWWLSYHVNEDTFNDSGARCYPWDNLEDYWSRYGKATPEQIQAVIDEGV